MLDLQLLKKATCFLLQLLKPKGCFSSIIHFTVKASKESFPEQFNQITQIDVLIIVRFMERLVSCLWLGFS